MMVKLTKEQREQLIQDYKETKESLHSLGNKYDISPQAVRGLLTRHKVYQPPSEKPFERKYFLNENVFSGELTGNHYYWLGFLWADGSITKKDYLSISLATIDEKILKDFLRFTNGTHPIIPYDNNGYPAVRLVIYSPLLVASLQALGYTLLKVDRGMPEIPTEHHRHFIRGYFDGDGGFDIIQVKNHRKLRGFFTGYPEVLEGVRIILNNETGMDIQPFLRFKHSPVSCSLMWKGNQKCLKFFKYLYGETPEYFMERKQALAKSVLSSYL
jgi:hypothetical protein